MFQVTVTVQQQKLYRLVIYLYYIYFSSLKYTNNINHNEFCFGNSVIITNYNEFL